MISQKVKKFEEYKYCFYCTCSLSSKESQVKPHSVWRQLFYYYCFIQVVELFNTPNLNYASTYCRLDKVVQQLSSNHSPSKLQFKLQTVIDFQSFPVISGSVNQWRTVYHIISALWWFTGLITERCMLHSSFLVSTSWLKCLKVHLCRSYFCPCVFFQLSSTCLIYSLMSINTLTVFPWWIGLLTLCQLQVNNYYSCFVVMRSIPGYCHLAMYKRLGLRLLFCIWSNVTHLMIHGSNRKCDVSEWKGL